MRILIVDDERDLALALKSGLACSGFAVDVAFDAQQGFALASDRTYDLVVLDRMLPGEDGAAVCRRLRAQGSRVPVLMLTARDAVDDRVEGLDAGADDYLIKPFALKELMARIRAQVRRTGPTRSETLEVADLSLDLSTGKVNRAGREIALSRKEFSLLAHLMRQPGRLFTKPQLLEHVWDSSAEPESDVVRAQVKNLRKKVDGPFNQPLIRTVYGMGYKIEA